MKEQVRRMEREDAKLKHLNINRIILYSLCDIKFWHFYDILKEPKVNHWQTTQAVKCVQHLYNYVCY